MELVRTKICCVFRFAQLRAKVRRLDTRQKKAGNSATRSSAAIYLGFCGRVRGTLNAIEATPYCNPANYLASVARAVFYR